MSIRQRLQVTKKPSEIASVMIAMFPQKDEKGIKYAFVGSFALCLLLEASGLWEKCCYTPGDIDVIAREDVNINRLPIGQLRIDVVKRLDKKDNIIEVKIGKAVYYVANIEKTLQFLRERLLRFPEKPNILPYVEELKKTS